MGIYVRWDSKFRRGLSGTTVKVKGENHTVALDPHGHQLHCSIGKRVLPHPLVILTVTHTALAILFSLGISWITFLSRNSDSLSWSDDEGQSDARQLWSCLHSSLSLDELSKRAHSYHQHTARILARLVQTEHVKPSVD